MSAARRGAERGLRSCAVGLVLLAGMLSVGLAAPGDRVGFSFSEQPGYGRMIYTFKELPAYKVTVSRSVVVLTFDRAIDIGTALTRLQGGDYLIAGRIDPDGKAIRFALAQELTVNTIEAGEQLFVDFLPKRWTGPPPGLPQDVITALARRAVEAEKQARRRAMLEEARIKDYKVKVRIGEQPTFTRIAFEWPKPPQANLSRAGDEVTIAFNQVAKPLIGRLKADPPYLVAEADAKVGDDGLIFTLKVYPQASIRGFREGNFYIVDISDPTGAAAAAIEAAAVEQSLGAPAPKSGTDSELSASGSTVIEAQPKIEEEEGEEAAEANGAQSAAAPAATPATAASGNAAGPTSTEAGDHQDGATAAPQSAAAGATKGAEPVPSAATQRAEEGDQPTIVISEKALGPNGDAALDDFAVAGEAEPVREAAAAEPPGPAPAPMQAPADEAAPETGKEIVFGAEEPAAPSTVQAVQPEARAEAQVTDRARILTFEFASPTAAAAFVRADALWLVFDSDEPADLDQFERNRNLFGRPRAVATGGSQIIRTPLKSDLRYELEVRGNTWTVFGVERDERKSDPVRLVRSVRRDGLLKVTARVPDAGRVHWVRDPVVGDRIVVVTAFGPKPTFSQAQELVEFATLASMHGVVLKNYSDDVAVRLTGDQLLITRSAGLTLSAGSSPLAIDGAVDSEPEEDHGLVNFAIWSAGDGARFDERVEELEMGIALIPGFQAVGLRVELAKLYLANQLGPEALGQLDLMSLDDPDIRERPVFHAMRAIAQILMGRAAEAAPHLNAFGVRDEPTLSPWRGLQAALLEKWDETLAEFERASALIDTYPEDLQARFRMAAARAAVETEEWPTAEVHLDALPQAALTLAREAQAMVLRARILEGYGKVDEAIDAYVSAIATRDQLAEAEATYYSTQLALRLGKIAADRAIDRLESAGVMWRGDALELKVLRALAELYSAQERYRRALEIMKTAVVNFPDSSVVRNIHSDMNRLFRELYLEGKADDMPPVQALGLYYDFRELTPVGRLGDEMIRKLADRLIAVDLLNKAQEILAHQVEKRLTGAARAQVAAKLATVYMLDRKPDRALQVLRRTRQVVLPDFLQRKRRLLEARALSELGLSQQAVDLLSSLEGRDVDAVRAEAYWKAEDWAAAGQVYEKLLDGVDREHGLLSDAQRVAILKAAIAYSLADDRLSLDRFRAKFVSRMQETRDARAFDVLTKSVDRDSVEFQNLAKEIAAIDTLEKFLNDFRESLETSSAGGQRGRAG